MKSEICGDGGCIVLKYIKIKEKIGEKKLRGAFRNISFFHSPDHHKNDCLLKEYWVGFLSEFNY